MKTNVFGIFFNVKGFAGKRSCWRLSVFIHRAINWRQNFDNKKRALSEKSAWWVFAWSWEKSIKYWLHMFKQGLHQFSPMIQYQFPDESICVWSYLDRLMVHLILTIIRPTFKHIISSLCLHLRGPSAIKGATSQIKSALCTQRFNYVMRIDIRSYYASINHQILLKQLTQHFQDAILLKYLEAIVVPAVDCNGIVFLPKKGIALRSSLSPFFGALYLSELDKSFEKRTGVFYLRYMDDIIVLIETKRQYQKARKCLFKILKGLQLQISPHKTRMGRLLGGFHYLGVNFEVSQNPHKRAGQEKKKKEKNKANQIQAVTVAIHNRTCCRALDKVKSLTDNAVHPAHIQRYLIRWAAWWHSASGLETFQLINKWVNYVADREPSLRWLGSGLLFGQSYVKSATVYPRDFKLY